MNEPFEWREAPPADYAVIGDPIGHSLSPKMMAAASEALHIPFWYNAVHVPSGEVGNALEFLSATGYKGVNVTAPHKEEAWRWLENSDDSSNMIQAVNTIDLVSRNGINTDGPGFMDSLIEFDLAPRAQVLVLGAGGSSRAICLALAEAGYRLRLWNRTPQRAAELVGQLGIAAEVLGYADLANVELIVNATSAGLSGQELDLDWSKAKDAAVAYDLSYGSAPTAFLNAAAARGLKTTDGIPLLVAQGARSLEWWLGVIAPREAMLNALR